MMAETRPEAHSVPVRHDIAQRPGAVTLVALVATICVMALGVLMAGMSSSAMAMAKSRGDAVTRAYRCETVAQRFVASLDATVAEGMSIEDALRRAQAENPGVTEAWLSEDGLCHATVACDENRVLEMALSHDAVMGLEVTMWELRSVPSEEGTMGHLVGT